MGFAYTFAGYICVGGVLAVIFFQKQVLDISRRLTNMISEVGQTKDIKPKKARRDGARNAVGQEVKKRVVQAAKTVSEETAALVPQFSDKEDEIDNKEFARQLLGAKTGIIAAPKSQSSSRTKSVKQGRAQEKLAAETSSDNATAPSSTTGGDADDELNSPDLAAVEISSPVAGGDISDMLDKPAAPAGVLKVLAPTTPTPAQKPKPAKKQESVETKKQRQNRQKAEEAKQIRAQEEQERKVKMEQQRRTAREADGRAAKDGSSFMASKAPTTSVWTESPTKTNGEPAPKNVELLDTYTAPIVRPVVPEETYGSAQAGLTDDEAFRHALEESESWNEVKGKTKKSKAHKENGEKAVENRKPEPKEVSKAVAKPAEAIPEVKKKAKAVVAEDPAEDDEWEVS